MKTLADNSAGSQLADWLFGALVLAAGIATLVLVHPVPAIGYFVASLAFLPPPRAFLSNRLGFSIHPLVRIALGVAIVVFTLGVSDLGEMMDGPGKG